MEFADGTVWAQDVLTSQALTMRGTGSADTLTGLSNFSNALYGNEGSDTLKGGDIADLVIGGEGNDSLLGGSGDGLYRYLSGDGYDTLADTAGFDVLSFDKVDPSTAHFYKAGYDLEVSLEGGQGVLVKNQFFNATAPTLDCILFGGTSLTAAQLSGLAGPKP